MKGDPLFCFRCKYHWNQRGKNLPKVCPSCKNRDWFIPKIDTNSSNVVVTSFSDTATNGTTVTAHATYTSTDCSNGSSTLTFSMNAPGDSTMNVIRLRRIMDSYMEDNINE
jgi:hypothetical protein